MITTAFNLVAVLEPLFRTQGEETIPETEFTPFDLSYLRDLPKETDRREEAPATQPRRDGAKRLTVFPPAVPFNYPQA